MGTLNCIYFVLFAVGVGYAFIAVVLGGISDIDIPGVDIDIPGIDLQPGEPDIHLDLPFVHDISGDVDHPEVGFSPLSPITIATFITTFGCTGTVFGSGGTVLVLGLALVLVAVLLAGLGSGLLGLLPVFSGGGVYSLYLS